MMVLPVPSLGIALLLTLVAFLGLFSVLLREKNIPFSLWVALGTAVSFSFGWHVHEKAVLMIIFPLLAALLAKKNKTVSPEIFIFASVVANVVVMPLLHRRQETMLNWMILLTGASLQAALFEIEVTWKNLRWILLAAAPQFYGDFLHAFLLKNRLWFLPLILNSFVCALLLAGVLISLVLRIVKPPAVRKSKRA